MVYSENALQIYKNLYYFSNESCPEETHKRVSNFIGLNEIEQQQFETLLDNKDFRPNTPCLINAGVNHSNEYSNNLCACFIIGLEDSMLSITELWKNSSLIYSSGGGIGVEISKLRPKDAALSGGGKSSGPISFLKVLHSISQVVKSGGRTRRAANLISCKYTHKDILEFINCKKNIDLSSMNLSVLVDDEFMNNLEDEKNKIIWDNICKNAYETGDPGLLFYNSINDCNPFPNTMGDITTTNPCGEVPLPDWTSCNLGSINLNNVLSAKNQIDWEKFRSIIKTSVMFLDNVITKTSYINDKFKWNMQKILRPIGLGIMGFADILYKMKIRYGSESSIILFSDICQFLTKEAYIASSELVTKYGREKLNIPKDDSEHFNNLLIDRYNVPVEVISNIRNGLVTCIAPTGSISLSADCSYAFEPHFAIVWKKQLVDRNETLFFVNNDFNNHIPKLSSQTGKSKEEIINDIIDNHGSIQNIDYIPDELKQYFVTAHDIDYKSKLKIQAEGQKYITLAISSTCNLPNSATIDDIRNIYKMAYDLNLKGITVYRDGCLQNSPVIFGGDKKEHSSITKERPRIRIGKTIEIKTPHGTLYFTGNLNEKSELIEVFIRIGKQGTLVSNLMDSLARVISKAIQSGVAVETIIDTLIDTQGEGFWAKIQGDNSVYVSSVIDLISRIISTHFIENNNGINNADNSLEYCPKCERKTVSKSVNGCKGGICLNCGYSSCG